MEVEGVHVDGVDHGEDEDWQGAHELVEVLVGNDGKWGWVEEDMVSLVVVPHGLELVATPVDSVNRSSSSGKGKRAPHKHTNDAA